MGTAADAARLNRAAAAPFVARLDGTVVPYLPSPAPGAGSGPGFRIREGSFAPRIGGAGGGVPL